MTKYSRITVHTVVSIYPHAEYSSQESQKRDREQTAEEELFPVGM